MDVLFIVGRIFAEFLIVILGVTAFALLFQEYGRRHRPFLLFFIFAFFSLAAGFGFWFAGQMLVAYGQRSVAASLAAMHQPFLILHSLFVAFALIDLFISKRRPLWFAAAAALSLASFFAIGKASADAVAVHGLMATDLAPREFLMFSAAWAAVSLLLIVLPSIGYAAERATKGARNREADVFLRYAGVTGLAYVVIGAAAAALTVAPLVLVMLAALFIYCVFLFFGAAAKENPDGAVAQRPTGFIARSLILKIVGLNSLLFMVLAFVLVAITSTYFVSASTEDRKIGLSRDLHYLTKSHSALSKSLLEETLQLASVSALSSMLMEDGNGELPAEIRAYVEKEGKRRIVRVVDAQGVVRYSSHSAEEVGQSFASSYVVNAALQGTKAAATEKESALGAWMVRAAAPIVFDDGVLGGVILGTDIGYVFNFGENLSFFSSTTPSGYGFISEGGEQIYTAGSPIDGLAKAAFKKSLGDAGSYAGEREDGAFFSIARAYATDGTPNGFFYILLTRSLLEAEIFRILSVVTFMVLLSVLALMSVMVFSIMIVLRPIRELRRAAREIEREHYDVRVDYRSPDELGVTAAAFNRMVETIAVRTRNLRVALQEERDCLMYTASEMRDPLNIFRWTLELMRFGDTGKFNKEQLDLLEQMRQTNTRLFKMAQKLIDAAEIDDGRLAVERAPVAIEEVIESVAGLLSVQMRQKSVALHWSGPDKGLPKAYGDREKLRQILLNLMSNAVAFVGKNGHIGVSATLVEEAAPGGKIGKFIKVGVEDNGRGIPEDQQDRVFSRFFRASNVVKSEASGLGLGLYITRKLVVLHGGRIWFDSKEGAGTKFFFTIPAADS